MSSSFRNVGKSHRRTHRERAQPRGRAHLGLLEKKRDYLRRARDFHRKDARLRVLREKAATRNPDEFYYGMVHARTVDGATHRSTRPRRDSAAASSSSFSTSSTSTSSMLLGGHLDAATKKLFDTQDGNYVRYKAALERAHATALRGALHGLDALVAAADEDEDDDDDDEDNNEEDVDDDHDDDDDDDEDEAGAKRLSGRKRASTAKSTEPSSTAKSAAGGGKRSRHVVFVDSAAEAQRFSPEEYFATPAPLLKRTFNRPRTEQLATTDFTGGLQASAFARVEAERSKAYRELQQRTERLAALSTTLSTIELKKALAGKGAKKLVKPGTATSAPVYRWRAERKK
jgi:U3 small nucleolar RNA-associated protein 11